MRNSEQAFNQLVGVIQNEKTLAQARLDSIEAALYGWFDPNQVFHPAKVMSESDTRDMRALRQREIRVSNTLYGLLETAKRIERTNR